MRCGMIIEVFPERVAAFHSGWQGAMLAILPWKRGGVDDHDDDDDEEMPRAHVLADWRNNFTTSVKIDRGELAKHFSKSNISVLKCSSSHSIHIRSGGYTFLGCCNRQV